MNARQHAKLRMYKSTNTVIEQNRANWENIPIITSLADELKQHINSIENASQLQGSKLSLSQQKAETREALSEKAMAITGILKTFAEISKNKGLAALIDYTKTDFTHSSEQNTINIANTVLEQAGQYLGELADYGLTQATIDEYAGLFNEFKNMVEQPRNATIQKSYATKELAELFEETDNFIDTKLDNMLLQFQGTSFYNQYVAARVIVDAPTRSSKTEEQHSNELGSPA